MGHASDDGKVGWKRERVQGTRPDRLLKMDDKMMQVCASYKYRRDLVEGVVPSLLPSGRLMTQNEAMMRSVQDGGHHTSIDSPDLRQGLAWELAVRAVRKNMVRYHERKTSVYLISLRDTRVWKHLV